MLICDISTVTCKIHDGKYIQFKSGTMKLFTSRNIVIVYMSKNRQIVSQHAFKKPTLSRHTCFRVVHATDQQTNIVISHLASTSLFSYVM